VAHGVVVFGPDDVAWRVVRVTAPPPANAAKVESTTGFLLTSDGVLLVANGATGEQTRLAAGEAALTQRGHLQVRAALGPNPATYYAIELVAAGEAAVAGDGELILAGDPFAGPDASHDVDLVRDLVDPGLTVELPPGAAPTLVLVTAGAVDAATENGDVIRVDQGTAAVFTGALVLTAAETGAVVVAAVIGPTVPALTGPEATARAATPEPASAEPTASPDEAVAETPGAEPAADDRDGDGLTDEAELTYNTDPALSDTDGDGLTDGDEVNTHATAPLARDSDGDGVIDGEEIAGGTDPNDPASLPGGVATADDSDGDGFLDVDEINLGTDPSDTDTDDDGLTDGDEWFVYATGPLNPDTDADGVVDGTEIANGTDPNDPNSF
jgi:hypothetical protein